ncbi:MAG: GNAT family N-acetyltransferase [Lachnospiraceae bacterium]|nr:GNAT family N-acetyltransferase [Lachnospiraceae bacterium]
MIRLRPYKRKDAAVIASWISNEDEFIYWSAGKLGSYPVSADTLLDFAEHMEDNDDICQMTAMDDDLLIGYCVLDTNEPDTEDNNKTCIRIRHILVNPEVRGRGYGMGMLELALKYGFDILKSKKIVAEAFCDNDAQLDMYHAVGFSETGPVKETEINGRSYKTVEVEIYSDSKEKIPEDTVIPEDNLIGEIINDNRFRYAFQPIVDTSTGEIFGYEALMRADFGMNVSPITILDYATRENRLYDIEKLTFVNVMQFYADNRQLFGDRKVFINSLPGYQMSAEDYDEFKERFKGLFSDRIVVEITENTEFKNQELEYLLKRSVEDSFELAIDDFGTGYSNTSSLLTYTPSYLKIDRLLISGIHEDTKKQHFVKGIVEFAAANGVKTLAEGVETGAELRMVVDLGIDLIQGFYTARPAFDVLEYIDENIKNEIISSAVKGTNQDVRKIYALKGEKELPVMRLALEKYTGILIDQDEFVLVGNTGYSAEMSIKIKDGCRCRLTIRNLFIESTHQLPCIELGKNSELTLVLEGENRLFKYGILVPDTSRLVIEGKGNLQIRSQGISSYSIGNNWNAGFGDIRWLGTGSLDILVEADEAIGIGGGRPGDGCGISLLSGTVRIEPASGKAISIGSVIGEPEITVSDCRLQLDIKIDSGVGIGCLEGTQHIRIRNANLNIMAAGRSISSIGTPEITCGDIILEDSEIIIRGNGQQLYLIGAGGGELEIRSDNSALDLKGEGNVVLALGSGDNKARLSGQRTICNIKLSSATPIAYGATSENTRFINGLQSISINE